MTGSVVTGEASREVPPASAAPQAGPPRPRREPSWPRVLATTVRLWLARTGLRTRTAILAVVLALIAGSVVLATRHTPSGTGRSRQAGQKLTPAAAAGTLAAAWVAGQVSRSVTVSCDPAMCAALQQRGFPAGNLVIAGRGALDPRDSSLIVVTAALRNELGRRLDSEYAPVVLAVFGAGNDKIEIRASAPDGPAAYQSQFNADFAARKSVGTELLLNPNVEADQPARQQLSEGRVDSRLIGMIGIMAMMHPVHLVSFGDASPGASPEVPLRSALLYGVAHGATAGTAVLGSLRTLLLAQRPSYRPAGVRIVRLTAGRNALRIEFAAPDPLGLLDASQPLVKISSP